MNRHLLAAVTSIVLITFIALWNVRGPLEASGPSGTLGGNAFAAAVANGAPVQGAIAPLAVTIQANAGTLPAHTTVVPHNGVIRYRVHADAEPATMHGIAIELPGSEAATSATFSVTHTRDASTIAQQDSIELVSSRSVEGMWFTLVSAEQLETIRTREGPGWYVFTASAQRGTDVTPVQRFALFIP